MCTTFASKTNRPVSRLTLLFFSAAKVPEAAETVSARAVLRTRSVQRKGQRIVYDESMRLAANAITRRACGRALGGAFLWFSAKAAPPGGLSWSDDKPSAPAMERRYRGDAQILLFSLPLLHKSGVGGGSAVWRESDDGSGGRLRLLEFNGYSLPARAAGLNRLGFIRELCRVAGGRSVESIYFGLMTSSPEESAEQGRRALHTRIKEQAYSTIDGRVQSGQSEATLAHFMAPASITALDRTELVNRARRALDAQGKLPAGPAGTAEGAHSFLAAVSELLLHPERRESAYVYSGNLYSLRVERTRDPKTASYFAGRKVIGKTASVTRVSGRLRRRPNGEDVEFRVWVEDGAERPLPLRIEYQAKSYLRLVFEAS